MGRATLALLNGDIPLSFSYNILCIPFTFAIIISISWLTLDLVRHRETFFKYVNQEISKNFRLPIFALIIINWTINIVRL